MTLSQKRKTPVSIKINPHHSQRKEMILLTNFLTSHQLTSTLLQKLMKKSKPNPTITITKWTWPGPPSTGKWKSPIKNPILTSSIKIIYCRTFQSQPGNDRIPPQPIK
jgi:hypothetical protein